MEQQHRQQRVFAARHKKYHNSWMLVGGAWSLWAFAVIARTHWTSTYLFSMWIWRDCSISWSSGSIDALSHRSYPCSMKSNGSPEFKGHIRSLFAAGDTGTVTIPVRRSIFRPISVTPARQPLGRVVTGDVPGVVVMFLVDVPIPQLCEHGDHSVVDEL
uniref:Uncharacterized protein n=1 Tax=Anopheles merus TaxID=30066 RepID=A0A182UPX2_ANOME